MTTITSPENDGIHRNDDYHQVGDYIVPHYSEHGYKLGEGVVVGTEADLHKAAERIANSALQKGSMLPSIESAEDAEPNVEEKGTTKKTAKGKAKNKQFVQKPIHVLTPPKVMQESQRVVVPNVSVSMPTMVIRDEYKPIDIVFHNKFGKITLSVESVIEEDMALCLVFHSEKELRFIPDTAEELILTTDKNKSFKVLFPGILFTWIDNKRKLMILVKIPQDTENES